MEKAKVYFTKNLTKESLVNLYKTANCNLEDKVAVKVHSGEEGNQNFLHPEYFKDIIDYVNGTVVECNTAYDGARNTTEKHKKLLENHVGKNIKNYDSMLVLSHFKGHPMGGYGGALKQLSIGCASSYGKAYIHGVGVPENLWTADHDSFLESMADAASSVVKLFNNKIVYINVLANMSVDCDCCSVAEDPCMKDIGIVLSTDPVAIDKACLDMVYNSSDPGKHHLIERIESRNGYHTIESAEKLGIGTTEYELINID